MRNLHVPVRRPEPSGTRHASRGKTRVGFCSLRGHPKMTFPTIHRPGSLALTGS